MLSAGSRIRRYVLTDNPRMLDRISRFRNIKKRKTDQSVTELLFTPRRR